MEPWTATNAKWAGIGCRPLFRRAILGFCASYFLDHLGAPRFKKFTDELLQEGREKKGGEPLRSKMFSAERGVCVAQRTRPVSWMRNRWFLWMVFVQAVRTGLCTDFATETDFFVEIHDKHYITHHPVKTPSSTRQITPCSLSFPYPILFSRSVCLVFTSSSPNSDDIVIIDASGLSCIHNLEGKFFYLRLGFYLQLVFVAYGKWGWSFLFTV